MSLDLPQGMDISYRYAVCCFVEPQDSLGQTLGQEKKTVVRRWETSLRPRKITCHGKAIFSHWIITCSNLARSTIDDEKQTDFYIKIHCNNLMIIVAMSNLQNDAIPMLFLHSDMKIPEYKEVGWSTKL